MDIIEKAIQEAYNSVDGVKITENLKFVGFAVMDGLLVTYPNQRVYKIPPILIPLFYSSGTGYLTTQLSPHSAEATTIDGIPLYKVCLGNSNNPQALVNINSDSNYRGRDTILKLYDIIPDVLYDYRHSHYREDVEMLEEYIREFCELNNLDFDDFYSRALRLSDDSNDDSEE